jgi:ABC-type phosphate transport system substrate-binding protein
MKKFIVIIASFLFLQMNCLASYGEEYVLICHKDGPVDTLTSQQVKRIFLGKMKKWPGGSSVDIVVNSNKDVHAQFTRAVLNKSPSQLSNYWKKILFSGRSMLPVFVKNDLDAKRYVAEHTNALTYIDVTSLDETLKQIVIVE